jgi:zinc and cadmium transporter
MSILGASLLGVAVVSLLSFTGALSLVIKEKWLHKILIFFVSFSAGSLIGGAFFHLLPESLEGSDDMLQVFVYVLFGFCLFFILERVLRWHHCHKPGCEIHVHLGYMNIFGDGIHNFIDGMIIFAAFSASPAVGLAVTLSIIFHEIPQEISDFGVLLYSGFTKVKALAYNFISALISVVGVVVAYVLSSSQSVSMEALLAFAAGGFIYIAASDLIPELHKERRTGRAIISFVVFGIALIFMYLIKVLTE